MSEFASDPVSEGWNLVHRSCGQETWNEQGWYHQDLGFDDCLPEGEGGQEAFRHSLDAFIGTTSFFVEFRIQTDGDRTEIPSTAPAALVLGNNAGLLYHLTIAQDLARFIQGDIDLLVLLIEIAPGVPHTYRIELYPDRYAFYIDASLIDEGVPEGPYPASTPRITWLGRSRNLPCHNAWDYIRYGIIPNDATGDYDSDYAATHSDYYFVHECLTKDGPGIFGGPGENAGPGCRFTDFDSDADTDLADFADFQNEFGAPR